MRSQSGFTLIEIMVVLVIIAGLAYLVGTNVIGRLREAKIETTKIQIRDLETALKLYKLDNAFYPETQQGLQALVSPPTIGRTPTKFPPEGYLEGGKVPKDAWGNDFIYIGPDQTQDGSYEIISPGPDGVPNTEDDISSRNIQ
ncbi:MAG: type II secretion system protein GspG [Deltaproteobacteria bacterium]|jgi:general secretion pathway protein G|nr:Type II secretion system protein G [bacterium HR37]GIW46528.1 MAG: type II secretion system protein GspG [Deltaproteobacteria bacterium]